MDAKTPTVPETPTGKLIAEGKTKRILQLADSKDLVTLVAKDDITAGDGAKHDVIPDKGRLATATTCNVFRLLKACGIPVAFEEQNSPTSFIAPGLHDAALRGGGPPRSARLVPQAQSAHRQGPAVPEAARRVLSQDQGQELEGQAARRRRSADAFHGRRRADPAVQPGEAAASARSRSWSCRRPTCSAANDEWKIFPEMRRIARHAFLALEKAWQLEGGTLVDLKVEFGYDTKGRLLLADVIDNDSWRVVENGAYIDKQVYRDGGALDDVAEKYRRVAEITGRFQLPRQRIILWRGSDVGQDRHVRERARRR